MYGEGLCFTLGSCHTRFPSSPKMQDRDEGTAQTVSASEAKPGCEEQEFVWQDQMPG